MRGLRRTGLREGLLRPRLLGLVQPKRPSRARDESSHLRAPRRQALGACRDSSRITSWEYMQNAHIDRELRSHCIGKH